MPSSPPTPSFRHGTAPLRRDRARAARDRRRPALRLRHLQEDGPREIDMSEHGFHVHGPHDHALEHEAHAEPHGLAGRLAVATAIIATIGALFAYMGGLTQANAGPLQERIGDQEDRSVEPVELLPGQEQQAEPRRARGRARARVAQGLLRRRDQALQAGEGSDQEGRREVRARVRRLEQAQRRADPPAPSLGAGDDGAADLDRDGGDRAAHQEPRACRSGSTCLSAIGIAVGILAWLHI